MKQGLESRTRKYRNFKSTALALGLSLFVLSLYERQLQH